MDDLFRAAILLNAAQANISSFYLLKKGYDAKDLFNNNNLELWEKIGLKPGVQKRLNDLLIDNSWPERELDKINRFNARFIHVESHEYPTRLKEIKDAPIGLYVMSAEPENLANLTVKSVAIVGTRRCSNYGHSIAESLGRALAKVGFAVISGGAKGIDEAGHMGCLEENGFTVAVMGTGLDIIYPSEHRQLFSEISQHGALVTEYPFGTKGEQWHFPERNRIIMGMAGRTVVVESPVDGGAMGTAKLTTEAGREIWSVPGRISDEMSRGTNNLIRDGAHALVDVNEFIKSIGGVHGQLMLNFDNNSQVSNNVNNNNLAKLTPDEQKVLAIIEKGNNMTFDDILSKSGLDFVNLQMCLINLTGDKLISQSMAGRYSALT
ncbi:MAG: DNA-processing protein DprA [Synergistaceae bacterium]|nr:DNA-processing protein DprA [Synergistaceae bacterium]MBQ9897407.1 DNA-processing protein DprA [Synergistaceae bacterium]